MKRFIIFTLTAALVFLISGAVAFAQTNLDIGKTLIASRDAKTAICHQAAGKEPDFMGIYSEPSAIGTIFVEMLDPKDVAEPLIASVYGEHYGVTTLKMPILADAAHPLSTKITSMANASTGWGTASVKENVAGSFIHASMLAHKPAAIT